MTDQTNIQPKAGCFQIHTDRRFQTVRDFGASLCWWSTSLGGTELGSELLKLLYTDRGLGLNVLRFNAGGGVLQDRSDSCSPDDPRRAPYSPLREDGSYDITADSGTLALLREAVKLGTVTDFTLFMNSPPSTMTVNGKTYAQRPETEGEYVSNLRHDCFEGYAKYVVDITELYINAGIPVKYVSPVNEPQWQWDDRNRQEGCHYTPEECVRIFRLVIDELKSRAAENPALANVLLSMPETAQWYQRAYVHDMYKLMCEDPQIAPNIDHFSAHSYGTSEQDKRDTRAYFDTLGIDIPLHQTEWAPLHSDFTDDMDFALELARVLWEDMTILHTDHWTWWLGVGGPSWPDGLIALNQSTGEYALPKRYYVMRQHSGFIRDHILVEVEKIGLPDCVSASAYQSEDKKELVVILVNHDAHCQNVMLAGIPAYVHATVYETSLEHDCACLGRIYVSGGLLLAPRSVTNLIIRSMEGEYV